MTLRSRAAQPASLSPEPRRDRAGGGGAWTRLWLAACLLVLPAAGFAQGTLAAWGLGFDGQTTPPTNLGEVTAIGAGHLHSLAVRADGRDRKSVV